MGYQPRILSSFENAAGTVVYTFPTAEYEWSTQQGLRVPTARLAGAHYDLDLLGSGVGLMESARETLRCVILEATPTLVDAAYDEMRSELQKIGQGKLYTIDNASVRRWAWARAAAMPQVTWRAGDIFTMGVALEFRRDSDWFAAAITNEGEVVNADPDTIVITNGGNAPVWNAIITLKGTFTNPSVTNSTTGYSFSSTRDGSAAAHWLKIDCGRGTVEWSTNSGGTYADDMALFTRGASQVGFMKIDPGDNSFVLTGCNGATLAVDFYAGYR